MAGGLRGTGALRSRWGWEGALESSWGRMLLLLVRVALGMQVALPRPGAAYPSVLCPEPYTLFPEPYAISLAP